MNTDPRVESTITEVKYFYPKNKFEMAMFWFLAFGRFKDIELIFRPVNVSGKYVR